MPSAPSSPFSGLCVDPTDHELGAAVESLLEIISQSRIRSVLWLIADARGRPVARVDPEDPRQFRDPGLDPDGEDGGRLLGEGRNAFKDALARGVMCCVCGKEHTQKCLADCVSLAAPITTGQQTLGCIGCLLPLAGGQDTQLNLIASFLSAAVAACEHVLKARQSVRELSLLRQAVSVISTDEPRIVVDAELRVQHVTRAAEALLHCPEAKLAGRDFREFCSRDLARALARLLDDADPLLLQPSVAGTFRRGAFAASIAVRSSPLCDAWDSTRILGWSLALSIFRAGAMTRKSGELYGTQYGFEDIVSLDPAHRQQIRFARMVAKSSSNILITGESGTGKELFAQAIHRGSAHASGPFVPINCSSLPRELAETELFGYREGAFTGAKKGGYKGKILLANQGTLFLDEVGDMPFELQAKLLRVLQERVVLPVGGTAFLPVNIRLIAATNQDLAALVERKQFRADLFYRLNVVHLRLIPLRERAHDILPLAGHFLKVYGVRLGRRAEGFTPAAEALLTRHLWPGNVRELENCIEYAMNVIEGRYVDACHLPQTVREAGEPGLEGKGGPATHGRSPVPEIEPPGAVLTMEEHEQRQIIRAMEHCAGNISEAARALGIGRTTFYRKLKKYKLEKRIQLSRGAL